MNLDFLDFKLLRELAANSNLTQAELAERVGLSTTACARRQNALENAGFIRGYCATLNLSTLGFRSLVVVRIALNSQSDEALANFEQAIALCPSVTRCFLMSGADDYLVLVVARDIEDFEHIHKTQLARLPGVARIQSSFALRTILDRNIPPRALDIQK
jgi:Lrp/AsnC family leucine-responsive transcriptional regulator